MRCSRGTYVRVLGESLAQSLGTVGHLTQLRRTYSGSFTLRVVLRSRPGVWSLGAGLAPRGAGDG